MAELTYRDALGGRLATLGAILIACIGLPMAAQGLPASVHAQGRPTIACGAWCNMCQPTYSCYEGCAQRGWPRVTAYCQRGRLPPVPYKPR